ncbi:hypothetical protein [Halalkalibacter hemicellulosilyticus]|uniref:Uncharacterized protein n=1 Tax=Halalkalibacter hemicellulosilyticusJCM 9152 TaxID=1236971 RepID=W4QE83_9BACI|nr:hypothetical protein [Halalkalibacter hemicellulosilyticus]GAE30370.1 hypothetical protein JCM9152_1776 [Halalkalibacter hemicellulosilyticusJCM 9152]
MEALTLLFVSIFLLTTYSLIYVSIRLIKEKQQESKKPFYRSFIYIVTTFLISGCMAAYCLFML